MRNQIKHRKLGTEPLAGQYYVSECIKCGWVGSSGELSEDAQCLQPVGDDHCWGDTDEIEADRLLGLVQAGEFNKPVTHPIPDPVLCKFYEANDWPELVRELVDHVAQLQDSAKRNVKPWEDTFPATLLPAYIERVNVANADAQHQDASVAGKCDQAVFDHGSSVCLVDIPKETAEVICRNVSAATGCKVDWHYIGGCVHIKALRGEQPASESVAPEGYCIMPRRLTAENGAKALLIGEFTLEVTMDCPECSEMEEPSEGCEICDGEGEYGQKHTISWDQIKFIYSKAVEGLAK